METKEQKVARLRALREDRDGTKLEQKKGLYSARGAARYAATCRRLDLVDRLMKNYDAISTDPMERAAIFCERVLGISRV